MIWTKIRIILLFLLLFTIFIFLALTRNSNIKKVVLPSEEDISFQNISTLQNDDFLLNTKKEFQNIVLEKDPKEAISLLKEKSKIDYKTFSICHDILHEIGHTAYKKYKNLGESLIFLDDFCNSGYGHGLFEEYFSHTKNPLENFSNICENSFKRKFDKWQCYHGIGHGLMYFTGGDLDESLNLCINSFANKTYKNYCTNGVYMEIFNTQILAKEINFIDKNNPSKICEGRSIDKNSCYLYLPTYYNQILKIKFSDIFDECKNVDSNYVNICIFGISSEALKRNMNNINDVFTLCKNSLNFFQTQSCVRGMVSMYVNQNASIEKGEELCNSLPFLYKFQCKNYLKDLKYLF